MTELEDHYIDLYDFSDEEPYEKNIYPSAVSEISHFYWDEDGLCVKVRRRNDQADYWDNDISRFLNTIEEVADAVGLVQLSSKVFVPVRNIQAMFKIDGGTNVDIGDLHVEKCKIATAELIRIMRNEYLRVYGRSNETLLNVLNESIEDHGGTPFLPGF